MKKKIITGIVTLAMALSLVACVTDKEITAERGTVEDNVYTNKSMGVQITLPEEATMLTDAQIKQMVGQGQNMVEDAYGDGSMDKSAEATIYDVVAEMADGSNIQIVMENTKETTGKSISAKVYAENTAKILVTTYKSMGIDVDEPEVKEEKLDGMEFSVIEISVAGMTQACYVHQVENYVFGFTMTYLDENAEVMQQIVDSVKAIQ